MTMTKMKSLNNQTPENASWDNSLLNELIDTAQESLDSEPKQRMGGQNTGRTIEVAVASENNDLVTISAPDGTVELQIKLTADGPILQVAAASIEMSATQRIALNCNELDVAVKDKMNLKCDGDMRQTVKGNLESTTEGTARVEARRIEVEAAWGDVDIKANDDVRLTGERIFLNK